MTGISWTAGLVVWCLARSRCVGMMGQWEFSASLLKASLEDAFVIVGFLKDKTPV